MNFVRKPGARLLLLVTVVTSLLIATPATAHEVRPALLELKAVSAELWSVRFHVPMLGEARLRLAPALPAGCSELGPHTLRVESSMAVEELRWRCPGGLEGRDIVVEGLSRTVTEVLVRIELRDGTVQTARILPNSPSLLLAREPSLLQVARTYFAMGVSHIALGWDHLAFVLALLLLVDSRKKLLVCVTAFTVAHSLTLALATLGLVFVPQGPVEACIALSVAFLAAELVWRERGERATLTLRSPWLVAFAFGLLHGLGFAGALAEVGLPRAAVVGSLLFFNLGVESGQLSFVAFTLIVLAIGRRFVRDGHARMRTVCAYGLGTLGAFWAFERVTAFFG